MSNFGHKTFQRNTIAYSAHSLNIKRTRLLKKYEQKDKNNLKYQTLEYSLINRKRLDKTWLYNLNHNNRNTNIFSVCWFIQDICYNTMQFVKHIIAEQRNKLYF